MLTENEQHDETNSVASGVISIGTALDLLASLINDDASNGAKGTLILPGEEDNDEASHDSNLSLPDSGLLPSGMTLTKPNIAVDAMTEQDGNRHRHHVGNHEAHCYPSTLLLLVALFLFTTSIASSYAFILSYSQIGNLQTSLQKQRAFLPFTLMMAKERQLLHKRVALLEEETANCPIHSNDTTSDTNTYLFENCYVKSSVVPGPCYKELDWFCYYNKSKSVCFYSDDEEESFIYQLFDSMRKKSQQSYSFVEEGLKDVTFDEVDLATLVSSSLSALSSVYHDSIVDDGSILTRFERQTSASMSRAVHYATGWLKDILEVVTEEDLFLWN